MTDEPDISADWARPLHARRIAMLGDLAETGLEIAHQAVRLAKDAWDVDGVHTATLAHARVARAVRLTLMLQARFIKALEDRDAHWADLSKSRADDERRDKRARTVRIVGRVAGRGDRELECLAREAAERLDADDLKGDLLNRPVSELVAMICRDLGLDPDWPKLAQEAWAQEEMAAGAPGWPLAGLESGAGGPANLLQERFRPSG